MTILARLTLAAGAAAAFASPAARAETDCEARPAAVYFEAGSGKLSPASLALARQMAEAMEACGVDRVDALLPAGDLAEDRRRTLQRVFSRSGVAIQLHPVEAPEGDGASMPARRAELAPASDSARASIS